MEIKRQIMHIITKIKCIRNNITMGKIVQISPSSKISNRGKFKIGNNVCVHSDSRFEIRSGGDLEIGDNCDFNVQNRIEVSTRVIIGSNVITGPWVYISDANHCYEDITHPIKDQGFVSKGPLVIKDNCWIGAHSTIVGNITIGKGCVIGANSVVVKDVPNYSVVAGAPAKILKQYNKETGKWEVCKK